jgi:hypothetical protein
MLLLIIMKYRISPGLIVAFLIPILVSAQVMSVGSITKPHFAGIITSIIIPTLSCPFISYVVTGPASMTITPIPPQLSLMIGEIIMGRRKAYRNPLCPGWQVYDASQSNNKKSGYIKY